MTTYASSSLKVIAYETGKEKASKKAKTLNGTDDLCTCRVYLYG